MESKKKGTNASMLTVKDWKKTLESLSGHNKVINEQFPKALEQFPELTAGFITTIGYLTSEIRGIRWQVRFGETIDLGGITDPLDPQFCIGLPDKLCSCIHDPKECGWMLGVQEIPGLDPLPVLPKSCESLIKALEDAYDCYENIDSTLPNDEYITAIRACELAVDEAKEDIISSGCECTLLRHELEKAVACLANPPVGTTREECQAEVDRIIAEMDDLGCD